MSKTISITLQKKIQKLSEHHKQNQEGHRDCARFWKLLKKRENIENNMSKYRQVSVFNLKTISSTLQ